MKQMRKNNMRYLSTLHNDILGCFFYKRSRGKSKEIPYNSQMFKRSDKVT